MQIPRSQSSRRATAADGELIGHRRYGTEDDIHREKQQTPARVLGRGVMASIALVLMAPFRLAAAVTHLQHHLSPLSPLSPLFSLQRSRRPQDR